MSDTTQGGDTTSEIPREILELAEALEALPEEYRQSVAPLLGRVIDSNRRRRRILGLVQELGQLRLDMKYLAFDLEATRRERDAFRQIGGHGLTTPLDGLRTVPARNRIKVSKPLTSQATDVIGMEQPTAENIAQRLRLLGLLDERKLREIWAALGTHEVGLDEFIQFLVGHEHLTNYQAKKLLKGDRAGYFFGNYRVLYLVGHGTFARVFRAAHRETGKIVAIKVLRSRFSENPVQASLFVREGRLGCVLRHPNIVPIYEVFSKGRSHFLVMEFVEGQNLRQFIRYRKKIEPVEAGANDDRHHRRVALRLGARHDPPRSESQQRAGFQPGAAQAGGLRPGLDR